ncbi:MAG: 16S rRNA (guanine(966)-N(2))-methyltransferase RsmD [Desulfuromonadaceae bacterium]|nr:16S rRNA (guanine(966)-N(2))-methyltransferase RsmD [Desulfuromonadaceae bacterium]
MRVISGSAKGSILAGFPGKDIRPTSDRIREAIFSILYSRLGGMAGKKVLDLFAGTGAMGIEALSRGAAEAWFVERSCQAVALIRKNLGHCRLENAARILAEEATASLPLLRGNRFDLIFVDPPYGENFLPPVLTMIDDGGLLSEKGVVCAEGGKKDQVPEAFGSLIRFKMNTYGSTVIHFFCHLPEKD